jgi:hypothetical protein
MLLRPSKQVFVYPPDVFVYHDLQVLLQVGYVSLFYKNTDINGILPRAAYWVSSTRACIRSFTTENSIPTSFA